MNTARCKPTHPICQLQSNQPTPSVNCSQTNPPHLSTAVKPTHPICQLQSNQPTPSVNCSHANRQTLCKPTHPICQLQSCKQADTLQTHPPHLSTAVMQTGRHFANPPTPSVNCSHANRQTLCKPTHPICQLQSCKQADTLQTNPPHLSTAVMQTGRHFANQPTPSVNCSHANRQTLCKPTHPICQLQSCKQADTLQTNPPHLSTAVMQTGRHFANQPTPSVNCSHANRQTLCKPTHPICQLQSCKQADTLQTNPPHLSTAVMQTGRHFANPPTPSVNCSHANRQTLCKPTHPICQLQSCKQADTLHGKHLNMWLELRSSSCSVPQSPASHQRESQSVAQSKLRVLALERSSERACMLTKMDEYRACTVTKWMSIERAWSPNG